MRLTRSPRLSSRQPMEAAASPLPRLDTTPPVTKTYFADMNALSSLNFGFGRTWWAQSSMTEIRWRRKLRRRKDLPTPHWYLSCHRRRAHAQKKKRSNLFLSWDWILIWGDFWVQCDLDHERQ